jgi:cytochrome c oxidase subunit IV
MSTQPVQSKPTAAFVISLIGALVGAIWGFLFSPIAIGLGVFIAGLSGFGIWILVCSLIIFISAAKLNSNPWEHTKWGTIILIFSIIGIFTLIAVPGGLFALVYEPIAATPPQPPTQPATTATAPFPERVVREEITKKEVIVKIRCSYCGTPYDETLDKCPHCGAHR